MNMSGKTAVVTGAGAGIGRGVALKFAEHGARVAAVDINFETARETAREIRQRGGEGIGGAGGRRRREEHRRRIREDPGRTSGPSTPW